MTIRKFDDLLASLNDIPVKKKVAVVGADDDHTLGAVMLAHKNNLVSPVLIGDEAGIRNNLAALGYSATDCNIIHSADNETSVRKAVELIHCQKADFIMKGKIDTAHLMKVIVDKQSNLRTGRIMSHIAFFEIPSYHKLLVVTDVALNPYPNLDQKRQIIENAVMALNKMGIKIPKIAVMSSAEEVNPKLPESSDAQELKNLYLAKEITDCIIEGPISYDLAISKEAVAIKKYQSPVAGDVDLMVVPNITSGNLLAKSLVYSGGAKTAGFIVGAAVPVVLTSRSATTEDKYLALVLAASAC